MEFHLSDAGTAAIKSILGNWARLSAGDISILTAALRDPNAQIVTSEGSANFRLWADFGRLRWAERVDPFLPDVDIAPRPAFFALTPDGREWVPKFLAHYDLKQGTFYTENDPPRVDPAAYARTVEVLAGSCPDGPYPLNMTLSARAQLRSLQLRRIGLALAAFAYDTRESIAAFLGHLDGGRREEADREIQALRSRIRHHWAFRHLDLPPPPLTMHECADGLGIGLGDELAEWLYTPEFRLARPMAWLRQYGPGVESLQALATEKPQTEAPACPQPLRTGFCAFASGLVRALVRDHIGRR